MCKHLVLYAPTRAHTQRVFRPETYERFLAGFEVVANQSDRNYTTAELEDFIPGYEAIVTGWGVAPLSERFFERADRLRMIAHSAGTVKPFFPGDLWEKQVVARGICVFSANHAIAYNVAEATIGYMIMVPRRWFEHALAIRTTADWGAPGVPRNGQYLLGSTVGIVSASKVGREVIRMLQPFDCTVLLYDPFVSEWEAGRLGVRLCSLDELFAKSDIVSVHAPHIPATVGLIGRRELKRMKDGATLINTSRGKVIDREALYEELRTGRILAALDVTDPEPLAADDPIRKLPNVIVTPHISGAGSYGYLMIGELTLRALEDFFAGRPVIGQVPYESYEILA